MALENSPTVGHFAHPQHQSCFHLRLKILIPKIYKSHIPEPIERLCIGPGIHFYGCFGNLIQSPDLFLGKPGDLHNLIDAATLGSRLLKMLLKIYGYYENQKNNSKRSMHFCSVSREGVNPDHLFCNFLGFQFSWLPKPPGRLGIVQMLHQSLRPRCQCRSVTGRLGKKRRNFESLKSRCNLQNLRMFFFYPS